MILSALSRLWTRLTAKPDPEPPAKPKAPEPGRPKRSNKTPQFGQPVLADELWNIARPHLPKATQRKTLEKVLLVLRDNLAWNQINNTHGTLRKWKARGKWDGLVGALRPHLPELDWDRTYSESPIKPAPPTRPSDYAGEVLTDDLWHKVQPLLHKNTHPQTLDKLLIAIRDGRKLADHNSFYTWRKNGTWPKIVEILRPHLPDLEWDRTTRKKIKRARTKHTVARPPTAWRATFAALCRHVGFDGALTLCRAMAGAQVDLNEGTESRGLVERAIGKEAADKLAAYAKLIELPTDHEDHALKVSLWRAVQKDDSLGNRTRLADFHGITLDSLRKWTRNPPACLRSSAPTNTKPIMIDDVIYESCAAAARAHLVNKHQLHGALSGYNTMPKVLQDRDVRWA